MYFDNYIGKKIMYIYLVRFWKLSYICLLLYLLFCKNIYKCIQECLKKILDNNILLLTENATKTK